MSYTIPDSYYWIVGLILLLMITSAFSRAGRVRQRTRFSQFHYERKKYFMTESEADFYKLLCDLFSKQYYIFPQVHLSSILDHHVFGQPWKRAFYKINQKSVDYVLCDKLAIRPLLAIELDDWSHEADDRQERDIEVGRILNEAKLPLVRINTWRSLAPKDIQERIRAAL